MKSEVCLVCNVRCGDIFCSPECMVDFDRFMDGFINLIREEVEG